MEVKGSTTALISETSMLTTFIWWDISEEGKRNDRDEKNRCSECINEWVKKRQIADTQTHSKRKKWEEKREIKESE